jgi:hypothetical protein
LRCSLYGALGKIGSLGVVASAQRVFSRSREAANFDRAPPAEPRTGHTRLRSLLLWSLLLGLIPADLKFLRDDRQRNQYTAQGTNFYKCLALIHGTTQICNLWQHTTRKLDTTVPMLIWGYLAGWLL